MINNCVKPDFPFPDFPLAPDFPRFPYPVGLIYPPRF